MQPNAAGDLIDRWVDAEQHGRVQELLEILLEDFRGVGPVGFVLSREAWLARFSDGWSYEQLEVTDLAFRSSEAWSIAIGIVEQIGTIKGRRTDGRYRATFFCDTVRGAIAGLQFTPLYAPSV